MKVTKAIIPAAGLGTRVLPASKSIPKEMLPIVDKPAIQYIVEEAVQSGITDILIITNRGKSPMEDHFDRAPELEERLLASGKTELYDEIVSITEMANIQYIRQKGNQRFGPCGFVRQKLCWRRPICSDVWRRCHYQRSSRLRTALPCIRGIWPCHCRNEEVTAEQILKYSSLKTEPIRDNLFRVTDMIEKPRPDQVLSLYSILGRCVLPRKFLTFGKYCPGAGGEIQLTDAMLQLARTEGMIGVDYIGTRYDMGNKLGILQASVEVGLKHPEIGAELREYLKKLAKTL